MGTNGENSGRDALGRFTLGNPGGPGGPRRRASELRRAAEEAITPEHVAAIVRKATRMGLEGDIAAMKLVLERTCGRAAQAPAETEALGIELPELRTADDCNTAIGRVIDSLCAGTVDRDAAKLVIEAIQTRTKAIEANEFEQRLAQLEQDSDYVGGRRR